MPAGAPKPPTIPLGLLGRPHGVRGELVFRPHNPSGVRLEALKFPIAAAVRVPAPSGGAEAAPVELIGARAFGDGSLVRMAGITDREVAARYTNHELLVPRALLPAPSAGEYYVADLVGLRVVDQAGRARGRVAGAYWNGQQDVLEIVDEDGTELLIPAVPDFLIKVDLDGGCVVIDDHE